MSFLTRPVQSCKDKPPYILCLPDCYYEEDNMEHIAPAHSIDVLHLPRTNTDLGKTAFRLHYTFRINCSVLLSFILWLQWAI